MKRFIKWISIVGGSLVILIVAALIVIPMVVDVNQYKPRLEEEVVKATGRAFSVGEDLNLSLFPWAGIGFSDLKMGNPAGFKEKEFLAVESFEVRVKLLPLLRRDVQVKRFVLKGPRVVLVKNRDGKGNWEGIGKQADPEKDTPRPESKTPGGMTLKSLVVGEFAISEGSILWVDHTRGDRSEITDISLLMDNIALDKPIALTFSAQMDKKPVSLSGTVGPVDQALKQGPVAVDLSVKALSQLQLTLKGHVENPEAGPRFDLAVEVAPFSPRNLMAAMDYSFPVKTADPKALETLALKARLKGDAKQASISEGSLVIDQSKLDFSLNAKDFEKPDIAFDLNLDEIDLDRYLPPAEEKKPAESQKKTAPAEKTDYNPFRRLVVNGELRVDKLKVSNARIQHVRLKATGKNGIFVLDPISLQLYQGSVTGRAGVDVRKEEPISHISISAQEIQVEPLLNELLAKDILSGTTQAKIALTMTGDAPEKIKQTLNGQGELLFKDGAVRGIDIAGMVRNVKSAFGLAEKGTAKPKTDFSELHAPFTITHGVVNTTDTRLQSPLLRIGVSGKADLNREELDFRVDPKAVATLKGQGDAKERSGITVPVLISGSFASPQFRPDLKGLLQDQLKQGIPTKLPGSFPDLKKGLSGTDDDKTEPEQVQDKVKGLLKGLPFGR